MAVTTKKLFPATSNATTTVFSPVGIQLNNQDDLDVYVTLSGGTRVKQLRQSTGSTATSSHPQVNNTDGLYFPAVSAGTTLYNYQLSSDNNTITFNSALPQGAVVFCERRTRDADSSYTSFASGSTIRATDLNNSATESNFTAQDGRNKALEIEGAIWNGDEISSVYVTSSNIVDGTIATVDIADGAITTPKLADGAVTTPKLNNLNVTTAKIADGAITTDKLNNLNVTRAKIANDAINGDKIANNVIGSEHYAPNSIGTTPLIDNAVTTAKIANDNVTTGKLATDSVTTLKIEDGAVTTPKLADLSVTTAKIASDNVTAGKLATGSVTTAKISDHNVTTAKIADANVTTAKLANDAVTTGKIGANQVTTAKIADSNITSAKIADANITTAKIADEAVTMSKIADSTIVTDSEQASHTGNDTTFYTTAAAESAFLRQDSSETITSGVTWSSDNTKVATTGAIDLRIIELVDDVGGFVPIDNETSFPTTNPDINTSGSAKGGTIVSVKAASTALAPQSGTTLTIANGRGTGNAVIITGVTATIPQGFGFLVETTATDHTYAFHRLLPVATQVATVANNITNIVQAGANVVDINNFADLYQISTSAPTTRADSSSLQVGDLWFDSSSNKVLMIYDGSSGDGFSAATPNQSDLTNINIVAGHITFTEDLGLITNAVNTGSGNNSVNTVATNISNVNTVANDLNESTSEIDTVATNIANVNTVGNAIANVNTTAGSIANVNAVAANATNINNVAADATDIGAVAGKATEIGRLGTADAVADLAILGTTDVVADLNTLATSAIVSDMDTLADISSNITTVAGISSNVTAVAGNATNINAVQANATNINAVAGNNSNITAVANNASNINSAVSNASNINSAVSNATNINTVAASIGDVNRYAAEYVIQSSTPSSPSAGDLWYNTGSNVLSYYTGGAFVGISPGIASLFHDPSPELAAALDCNDKNLTDVATISGNNLQIDFGTL